MHKHESFFYFVEETESSWFQGPVTRDFWEKIANRVYISALAERAVKSFPRWLSQRWNTLRVCPASDEIRSHICSWCFEIAGEFPLCCACAKIGYSLAEHARKVQCFGTVTIFYGSGCDFWQVPVPVPHGIKLRFLRFRFRFHNTGKLVTNTHWLSMPKIGYSLAEHTRKSFRRTTCIFRVFPLFSCHQFLCPLLPSL